MPVEPAVGIRKIDVQARQTAAVIQGLKQELSTPGLCEQFIKTAEKEEGNDLRMQGAGKLPGFIDQLKDCDGPLIVIESRRKLIEQPVGVARGTPGECAAERGLRFVLSKLFGSLKQRWKFRR